jgi:ribonuclease HI
VPEPTATAETDTGSAILWTDGAARGNPGPAGIGVVLKNPKGEILATEARFVGHTTNNVAEYRALLLGLERALECGIRKLEVRADSELLIRQLLGKYRVKNEGLKPLYQRATELLKRFESTHLVHVRREQNAEADRLANEGIRNAAREGG